MLAAVAATVLSIANIGGAAAQGFDVPAQCQNVYPFLRENIAGSEWSSFPLNRGGLMITGGYSSADWIFMATPYSLGQLDDDGIVDVLMYCRDGIYVAFGQPNDRGGIDHNGGIRVDRNYGAATWGGRDVRKLADVNGDGIDDIVGFGYSVIFVSLGRGHGTFDDPVYSIRNFTRKYGWGVQNGTRRYVVDVTGDGFADIVGFYHGGTVDVAVGNGEGGFAPRRVLTNFQLPGYTWTGREDERTLTDVDGDGLLDLVARNVRDGGDREIVAYSNGDGTFRFGAQPGSGDYGDWERPDHREDGIYYDEP